jgi:hypothetical protein
MGEHRCLVEEDRADFPEHHWLLMLGQEWGEGTGDKLPDWSSLASGPLSPRTSSRDTGHARFGVWYLAGLSVTSHTQGGS